MSTRGAKRKMESKEEALQQKLWQNSKAAKYTLLIDQAATTDVHDIETVWVKMMMVEALGTIIALATWAEAGENAEECGNGVTWKEWLETTPDFMGATGSGWIVLHKVLRQALGPIYWQFEAVLKEDNPDANVNSVVNKYYKQRETNKSAIEFPLKHVDQAFKHINLMINQVPWLIPMVDFLHHLGTTPGGLPEVQIQSDRLRNTRPDLEELEPLTTGAQDMNFFAIPHRDDAKQNVDTAENIMLYEIGTQRLFIPAFWHPKTEVIYGYWLRFDEKNTDNSPVSIDRFHYDYLPQLSLAAHHGKGKVEDMEM